MLVMYLKCYPRLEFQKIQSKNTPLESTLLGPSAGPRTGQAEMKIL